MVMYVSDQICFLLLNIFSSLWLTLAKICEDILYVNEQTYGRLTCWLLVRAKKTGNWLIPVPGWSISAFLLVTSVWLFSSFTHLKRTKKTLFIDQPITEEMDKTVESDSRQCPDLDIIMLILSYSCILTFHKFLFSWTG